MRSSIVFVLCVAQSPIRPARDDKSRRYVAKECVDVHRAVHDQRIALRAGAAYSQTTFAFEKQARVLSNFIDLSGLDPIAQGQTQFVYPHPEDEDVLVKTMQPRTPKKRRIFHYAQWRYKRLRLWHREYCEYLALLARFGKHFDRLPRYYGFCDTSEGPGYLTECLKGPDGRIAPTLVSVLKDSDIPAQKVAQLRNDAQALVDDLREGHVVFRDLTSKNIVVTGPDMDRLKLIDGLGTYAILPIRQLSRRINDRSVDKWEKRLMEDIDGLIALRS